MISQKKLTKIKTFYDNNCEKFQDSIKAVGWSSKKISI